MLTRINRFIGSASTLAKRQQFHRREEFVKHIVITGASSGIGLAATRRCLDGGYRVIATARKQEDLDTLQSLGALPVRLELGDEDCVRLAATQIEELCEGRIDTLFNNAGYGLQVAMEDATWDALGAQHCCNVIGPITLTNQLLSCLVPGSKLVFNSSVLGVMVVPFRGPYCMSKFALEAAADAYRLELEPLGIAVHLIQPGPIEAEFRANAHRALKDCLGDRQPRLDYSRHLQRLQSTDLTPGTLPAEDVAELFIDIVDGRKQKPRYLVTRVAKVTATLKRLLGSDFDRVAKKAEPVTETSRAEN